MKHVPSPKPCPHCMMLELILQFVEDFPEISPLQHAVHAGQVFGDMVLHLERGELRAKAGAEMIAAFATGLHHHAKIDGSDIAGLIGRAAGD